MRKILDVFENKIEIEFLIEYVKTLRYRPIVIKCSGKKRMKGIWKPVRRCTEAPKRFNKYLCAEYGVEIEGCVHISTHDVRGPTD